MINEDQEMKSRENSSATLVDMKTACSTPVPSEKINCNKKTLNFGVTVDDVKLLVDLFYQPFEHGCTGYHMLQELQWLISRQPCLHKTKLKKNQGHIKEEREEWHGQANKLIETINSVSKMTDVLCNSSNQVGIVV